MGESTPATQAEREGGTWQAIRARRSILLAAAFAALLLVIAASAFAVWHNAISEEDRIAELHNADMQSAAALATLRANVFLIGILTRDYLLDPNPANGQKEYVGQFEAIKAATEGDFRILQSSAQDTEQRGAVELLNREVEANWDPTQIILDRSPTGNAAQRSAMLHDRVRQRQQIVALTGQVESMMASNFAAERRHLTTEDHEFRRSLGWTASLALFCTFAILAGTFARILALERQSQSAEIDLRSLSVRMRTAQEEERKRLSRELHDQVGQMLTGLRMDLANMALLHADAESEFASGIARAKNTTEQALQIVRNTAMLLRPSMLDDFGLTPALAWLAKDVSRSSGLAIKLEVDPGLDLLPDPYRTCVYRVVQEALTNVSRHSQARSVELVLKISDSWVVGTIHDDGVGLSPRASGATRKGLGLLGMEERVRELGGSIRFASAPDSGTRVEIRVPRPAISEDGGGV